MNSYKSNKCKVFENNNFTLKNIDLVMSELLLTNHNNVQTLCEEHSDLFRSEVMKNI